MKFRVEVEIPRTGIKGRQSFWVCSTFLILVSKFEMFVLPTFIPRFNFLHICSIFPILVSIFELLALNA